MKSIEELLVMHEGVRLKPYRCTAGKLTIGIGRNLDDVGITPEEAIVMMRNDINRSTEDLKRAFPWFEKLNSARSAVLVDMCVNLGLPRLRGFKKTLALVEAGRYDDAAVEMLASTWAAQVGVRAKRLSVMMKTGEWE